jgi:hypothetical protein
MHMLVDAQQQPGELSPLEMSLLTLLYGQSGTRLGEWVYFCERHEYGKEKVVFMLYATGSRKNGGGELLGHYIVDVVPGQPAQFTRPCAGCGDPVRLVALRELFFDKQPLCDAHCGSRESFAERAAAAVESLMDQVRVLCNYFDLPPQTQ